MTKVVHFIPICRDAIQLLDVRVHLETKISLLEREVAHLAKKLQQSHDAQSQTDADQKGSGKIEEMEGLIGSTSEVQPHHP